MYRHLYRLVLRLCPRAERAVYGPDMEAAFAARVAAERERGRVAAVAAVIRGLADAAGFAAAVRQEYRPPALHGPAAARRFPVLERNVRETLRVLRRQPAYAAAVIGMLALGLGSSIAIFSVVYGVLLKPLPFPDADRLVQIFTTAPRTAVATVTMTEANFWDLRDLQQSLEAIGAWRGTSFTLTGSGGPRRVRAARVSVGFFRALAIRPAAGRIFAPGEDDPGANRDRVLLGHALWQEQFAADPGIVGTHLTLDGRPHEVVGVLPSGSPWLDSAEVFVPFIRRTNANRDRWEYTVIGRIKPGIGFAAAVADLERAAAVLAERYPVNKGQSVSVEPSSAWIANDTLRRTLWLLLGAAGLLLVIAAVNVTSLLLAHASSRMRESAVRAALGASRGDLVRERITESLVLSTFAAIVGLAIASGLLSLLRWADPGGIPRLNEVQLDGWAVLFGVGAALIVGVGTGVVPGLHVPVTNITGALRSGGRGATGDRRQDRLRAIFVAAEVALSLVLLVGAGLLVRSLQQVLTNERGFATENRLTATISLPASYGESRLEQTATDILASVERHPDVISAAVVSGLPLARGSTGLGVVPGDRSFGDSDVPWATWRLVSRNYFQTMGLPLVSGRTFTEQDIVGKPWRVVISKRLADEFWPAQNPIGRTLVLWKGQSDERGEIIGVVGDMRERGLELEPTLAVYFPAYGALGGTTLQLVVHTRTDSEFFVPALRQVVQAIDPTLPISGLRPLDALVAASIGTRRFTMLLLAAFAAVALVLALAGVYGVLAYSIARRTPEIGVRLALGAAHGRVLQQVIGRGLRPVLIGGALGLVGAFWLSQLMTSLLFEITARDPLTYIVVCAALLITALLASYLPARQVLHVDPVTALRND